MRVVGLAALAVCAGLWAGEAGAATWTYTGTGADLTNFATGAGFVGGPQYFFDLDTAIPLDQIDFYTSFRLLVFLGDDLYGDYNHQIGIVETITPHGANGQFTFPTGFVTQIGHQEYDRLRFNVAGPPLAGDALTTPWTLTITDNANGLPRGVPEPATWALMLLGFGLVGAALRSPARRLSI